MIPPTLTEIADAISGGSLILPSGSGDARGDSATAEQAVVSWLQNQNRWQLHSPNVGAGHNRSWYDLSVNNLYCDIKISALKSHDNTNAKKAIYYLLTGQDPDSVPNQNAPFFSAMRQQENMDNDRDFYFIVISKQDTSAFIVSLKSIAEVTPAPNNPPFQCKWNDCRRPVDRSWTEARQYLLGVWAESIKRNIRILSSGMPTHYPDFFRP